MASIHPSRMALIFQTGGRPEAFTSRRRSPSPARKRPSPSRGRSRSRERTRDSDRGRENGRGGHEEDRRGRDDGARNRDREDRSDQRRASPQYDDYRRPAPQPEGQAPWRHPENMYGNRAGNGPPQAGGSYGGGPAGGSDFMEGRRIQRENQVVNVWPPSPKAPARDLSPKRSKSSKKSKRRRSPSTSDSSSDEDRRRKERKERKRSKRDRERERENERRRHRSRSRSKSRRKSYEDDSEDERQKRQEPDRSRSKPRTKSPEHAKRSPSRHSEPEEDEWVVKAPMAPPPVPVRSSEVNEAAAAAASRKPEEEDSDDDDDVGPQPLVKLNARRFDERSYGGSLLRGEGSAMAAFLQDGTESRIPRRGEIGLTSDEIAKYEDVGYVMSGSRHRRMNAVRMRKENQVISAEEKRGILKLQKEERERRETILREEFNELVEERLKGTPVSEPKAK
ncbi:hypothetical protein DXG01_006888 [Tephrocybe rancida]|nr:hypothetical protein DXG01_006888 [Tephrocybe rancida]